MPSIDYDIKVLHSEVHSVEGLKLRFRAVSPRIQPYIRLKLNQVARATKNFMAIAAPGESDGRTARSIRIDDRTVYEPGGFGGGGYFTKAIFINTYDVPYLRYVIEGTGLYGPKRAPIFPAHNKVFKTPGDSYFPYSKGQQPQREWIYSSQRFMDREMRRAFEVINRRINQVI